MNENRINSMGEAKRRKLLTDADVEQRIASVVNRIKSEMNHDPDMANVVGRIYGHIFGGYERAINEEKALKSKPRMVLASLESALLTIIAAMADELIKHDGRLLFVESFTKRLGMRLSDYVQGNMPHGLKTIEYDDRAN